MVKVPSLRPVSDKGQHLFWGKQKGGDATIALRATIAWRELSIEKVLVPTLKQLRFFNSVSGFQWNHPLFFYINILQYVAAYYT